MCDLCKDFRKEGCENIPVNNTCYSCHKPSPPCTCCMNNMCVAGQHFRKQYDPVKCANYKCRQYDYEKDGNCKWHTFKQLDVPEHVCDFYFSERTQLTDISRREYRDFLIEKHAEKMNPEDKLGEILQEIKQHASEISIPEYTQSVDRMAEAHVPDVIARVKKIRADVWTLGAKGRKRPPWLTN